MAFGVEADLALVSVLAYRATAIWLAASIGLGGLRRTAAHWNREHARHMHAPATTPARALESRPVKAWPSTHAATQAAM
jgi:hypothetical protein